jgi:rhodanese-related sulfurtransferase
VNPRTLGRAAALLAVAAALVGDPAPPGVGADAARALATRGGAVSAVQLAGWIRDRREGLRVIDLRDFASFEAFHIPTAEHAALETLLRRGAPREGTVVLYADGALAAQAWVVLAGPHPTRVHWLRGGAAAWMASIGEPVLPVDATAEERGAWAGVRALSLYFGGLPHRGQRTAAGEPPAWFSPADAAADALSDALAGAVDASRRRGCGF